MNNNRKSRKGNYLIVFLLALLFINVNLITIVKSSSIFSHDLEVGTKISKVIHYDEQAWENTIGPNISPQDWFGGESSKVGAKSKTTIINWVDKSLMSDAVFINLVFPDEALLLFSNVSYYGYDFITIYRNYTSRYSTWKLYYLNWNFTSSEFSIIQKYKYNSYIIQHPQNFSKMLMDYNDYAGKINSDTTLQSLGISFPVLNGDDLIWQFIIRKFAVATPVHDYLTSMTKVLNCENITIRGKTIVFKKHGIQNYSVEVTYSRYGTISNFIVINMENIVIFKITSYYPSDQFLLILSIIALFVLGIIILIIMEKRRKLKTHKTIIEKLRFNNTN